MLRKALPSPNLTFLMGNMGVIIPDLQDTQAECGKVPDLEKVLHSCQFLSSLCIFPSGCGKKEIGKPRVLD